MLILWINALSVVVFNNSCCVKLLIILSPELIPTGLIIAVLGSFVLLSKLAEENKIKVKNKRRTNWILFGVSIITSIITSMIASVLFKIYIEQTLT